VNDEPGLPQQVRPHGRGEQTEDVLVDLHSLHFD
jgi:hypothetical protein